MNPAQEAHDSAEHPAAGRQPAAASRVLVLSAHESQLDRRIVAEVNTLAASGRQVTLVSVPTVVPEGGLDARVTLVVPRAKSRAKRWAMAHLARRLPRPLYAAAKAVWLRVAGAGADGLYLDYFLRSTPAGGYDVIHCHDLPTLPAAVRIRQARCPGARLIYDVHELFAFQSNDAAFQKRWSAVEREHIGRGDALITINESFADELARRYGVARPTVIYNSYGMPRDNRPLSDEAFLDRFRASGGGFKVLFQGSLTCDRNLDNLVLAVKRLGEPFQLFFLGTGPDEGPLRKRCRREAVSNVFFAAPVPQDQLLRYVARADLGVIPYLGSETLNNRYCTPNKLFEYIEAGVPVCASDLPELRRIIRGSGIGDVYAMDTPAAIADALEDCRRRVAQGEFAPSRMAAARETYSWRTEGRRLLDLYRRLGV